MSDRPPPLHVVTEVARLAALRSYRVLDAEVPALDTFAEMAARCMACPMGAVAFVDSDRIWFGATFGFTDREIPRQGSFCNETLQSPGPLVVCDAALESRFAAGQPGSPRFYAGAPLEDEDGYRIGAVYAFDAQPGDADPSALLSLSRVTAMTMGALTAYRETAPGYPQTIRPGPAIVQGWLGVRTKMSSSHAATSRPGLIVVSVATDSPAERAGIRPADTLLAIDGRMLRHSSDVIAMLANRPAAGHARLQLLRAGQPLERIIPIEPERPARPIRALAS